MSVDGHGVLQFCEFCCDNIELDVNFLVLLSHKRANSDNSPIVKKDNAILAIGPRAPRNGPIVLPIFSIDFLKLLFAKYSAIFFRHLFLFPHLFARLELRPLIQPEASWL